MHRVCRVAKASELKTGKAQIEPSFGERGRELNGLGKGFLRTWQVLRPPLSKPKRVMRFGRLRRNGKCPPRGSACGFGVAKRENGGGEVDPRYRVVRQHADGAPKHGGGARQSAGFAQANAVVKID